MRLAVVGSINTDMTVTAERIPLKGETLMGRETFEEKIGECTWEVALQIPYKVFFKCSAFTMKNPDSVMMGRNYGSCRRQRRGRPRGSRPRRRAGCR